MSEQEGGKFRLHKALELSEFIIAAKFLIKRALNIEAVARTFKQLWQSRNGFRIKDMGNHVVLFIFDNKVDTDKVFASEPWSFDRHLVVIQHYDKHMNLRDLSFNLATFWIQLYNVLIRFMNKEVAEGICSGMGEVCRVEGMKSDCGSFLRVRVTINASKLLIVGELFYWMKGLKKENY